jgi:NAD(P)-dependent dehydrogenase (short-subunit alcohol dehydrogenase family)
MARFSAAQIGDQSGRSFIVTGAISGLGFETARQLAAHGGRVLLTTRSDAKGQQAAGRLSSQIPGALVEHRVLDLADLDSVRAFAAKITAEAAGPDVLVNNAGVMFPPRVLTRQGNESQFATNHLGHFALTGLLLDKIRQSSDGRVVTVSSLEHRGGAIHFADLTGERSYSPRAFYQQSKFANVLFALELDRRLSAAGVPVRSVLAHPGWSSTNLQSSGPTGVVRQMMRVGNHLFAQSAEMGALSQLFAAVDPGAESGRFYGPRGLAGLRGYPHEAEPVPAARSAETARRLWELSEELTGVVFRF